MPNPLVACPITPFGISERRNPMNEEAVRQALQGAPGRELARRRKLLDAILAAFAAGGPEEATAVLKQSMSELEIELASKIEALKKRLQGARPQCSPQQN
jgi:hypothetical protein